MTAETRPRLVMRPKAWQRLRQASQVLSLLLFLYLLVETRADVAAVLPHDLFFRLDPLVGASAMLADRRWIGPMALGIGVMVLTLALGRVWCGWLCPLGAILDWTRLRPSRGEEKDLGRGWRQAKHFILLVILAAALLGNLTLLVLDPITILFRTATVALIPVLDLSVTASESVLYSIELFQGPVESFDQLVRGRILPVEPLFFEQGILFALLFIGIVALNAVRPRFWCRYLCPLGALLGLASKVSWLRQTVDSWACVSCGCCARACPTGTIEADRRFVADPAECTLCLDCSAHCPRDAVAFRGHLGRAEWRTYDPSRRQALASIGLAALGVGVLRAVPAPALHDSRLIRPPGVRENELLSRCVRCGECLRVCPTGGLQPALLQSGLEGLWTPVLVPRIGHCDYSCCSCGQICPTEAIPKLALEEKRRVVIGLAYIDQNRCIPWADGRDCIVCEEMCPLPAKAIAVDEQSVRNDVGETVTVRRPRVIRDRCIGCGICEAKCPLEGESAIRIYAPANVR